MRYLLVLIGIIGISISAAAAEVYEDGQRQINKTGDWTGTFDGLEGTDYVKKAGDTMTGDLSTGSNDVIIGTGRIGARSDDLGIWIVYQGPGNVPYFSFGTNNPSSGFDVWTDAWFHDTVDFSGVVSFNGNWISYDGDAEGLLVNADGSSILSGPVTVSNNVNMAGNSITNMADAVETNAPPTLQQVNVLIAASASSTTLSNLTDTIITGPAVGDLLRWDGTQWTNTAATYWVADNLSVAFTNLTADNAWHTLGISTNALGVALIPIGAKRIEARVFINDDSVGASLQVKPAGYTNSYAVVRATVYTASINSDQHGSVGLSTNRAIQYKASTALTNASMAISIQGWSF